MSNLNDISTTQPLPMRPPSLERVLIVGDGPVARALQASLVQAGAPALRWWRKLTTELPAADVVVLAVRDEAISEAATRVMTRLSLDDVPPILLHCAGALPAEEAFAHLSPRPLGAGVLHPLRAVAGEEPLPAGTIFAVEGDEPGRLAALRLVQRMNGEPLVLDGKQLPAYHAAAALVSNHAVALVDAGVEVLTALGLDKQHATRALAQLLASTASNLERVGLPEALTGPIARGDVAVVARHLLALVSHPDVLALYRASARRVTVVAGHKGRAGDDALGRIRALIRDGE